MSPPKEVQDLAQMLDGTITECQQLPDGSGFACVSMPLPKDHWLHKDPESFNVPPMPLRLGANHPLRPILTDFLRAAGKYALRSTTMNGKEMDFDPDALLQNLVVGFLGYHTEDGLSSDPWANPPQP